MSYDSSTSSWKLWRWVRFDLIFLMSYIYINSILNPFTSSSRSSKFKDISPWNIYQITMKIVRSSTRIVIRYVMKWSIHFLILTKNQWKLDNNIIGISQWRKSHFRINGRIRRNKWVQKRRTVRVTVKDPSRKAIHLSKVIWESYSRVHQVCRVFIKGGWGDFPHQPNIFSCPTSKHSPVDFPPPNFIPLHQRFIPNTK